MDSMDYKMPYDPSGLWAQYLTQCRKTLKTPTDEGFRRFREARYAITGEETGPAPEINVPTARHDGPRPDWKRVGGRLLSTSDRHHWKNFGY